MVPCWFRWAVLGLSSCRSTDTLRVTEQSWCCALLVSRGRGPRTRGLSPPDGGNDTRPGRLIRKGAIALLLMAASSHPAASGPSFPVPPPDVIQKLRHAHHRKDWLRITTADARYEARVSRIDNGGLAGLTPRGPWLAPPDPVPWAVIARIDRRTSGFR